jgi:hypothetical protein
MLRFQYDYEYTFGCSLPFQGQSLQSKMWPFLHGVDAKRLQSNKNQQGIQVSTNILCVIVASMAEAELGALYHNCQTGIIFCQTLEAMGHKQPKTPVHCDNATTVGIVNNTVKQQHLRSMEMYVFWISDKVAQDMYSLSWHQGLENLADDQSKHHTGTHHIAVCPWYLHMDDSPQELSRALAPSALKGCVGTLNDG